MVLEALSAGEADILSNLEAPDTVAPIPNSTQEIGDVPGPGGPLHGYLPRRGEHVIRDGLGRRIPWAALK